jgi:DNA-binding MarR family transcriptional regulator
VRLTHDVIGGLVGSRRPTVTLALSQLSCRGLIERSDGDRWRLSRSVISV